MFRAISRSLAPAALGGALALAATPVLAASGGWSAQLATALDGPAHAIINGVLWKCGANQCAAPAQGSRPVLVCQKVAAKFGPVARFTTPEGELTAAELAQCNGR